MQDLIDEGHALPRGPGDEAWDELALWKQKVTALLTAQGKEPIALQFVNATSSYFDDPNYQPTAKYIDRGIAVLEGLDAAKTSTIDPVHSQLEHLFNRFHAAALELSKRRKEDGEPRPTLKIQDEYDVQDLLRSFLRLHFTEVVPEDPAPKHGGKSSRIDLHLPKHSVWIEVKFVREGDKIRKVGTALAEDFEYYRSGDATRLYCFVYDPHQALLLEAREFESDMSGNKGSFEAFVYIRP